MSRERLDAFSEYAMSNQLFEYKRLDQIQHTVCRNCEIEVIDFDRTKEIITERAELSELPKSCDVLKISDSDCAIVLVEMKSFLNFKQWQLARHERGEHDGIVRQQIQRFDISKKFADSLWLLHWIWNQVDRDSYIPAEVIKVVATDIEIHNERNAEEFIEFTIMYLADESLDADGFIQFRFEEHMDEYFSSTQKPALMSSSQLEDYLRQC